MGNYKFKLSDMMPNAWFYKLRDMGRTKNQTPTTQQRKKKQSSSSTTSNTSKSKQPHQSNPRKSYYFTRELNQTNNRIYNTSPPNNTNFPPEPPRKSSSKQQRPKRRTPKTSSSSPFDSPLDSSAESEEPPEPEIRTDRVLLPTNDIIIDVDNNSIVETRQDDKLNEYDSLSELMKLPPIVTKPEKFNYLLNYAKKKETKPRSKNSSNDEHNVKGSPKVKILKEEQRNINTKTPSRRFSVSSPGVKLRINSPRISSRKIQTHGRKSTSSTIISAGNRRSLSDSFAIVKSSLNPQGDFRESMVEMIVQNNIRTSKDLEDLLACYLSLDSDEYHELIIKVFKQIWFDLTDNQ
uniref:Transcription repressor n=1 Tax=Medicago truncatula TaxID=3880 RepID=I3STG8_MEDTR|nr:unknown [Medicago truncatula]